MQQYDGDGAGGPLSLFLAFMQPLSPVRRGWPAPDGDQATFIYRPARPASAFAGDHVIADGDDDAAGAGRRFLPPAA